MKDKSISVGIIFYKNSEKEVRDCLNGIKNQTAISKINEIIIRDQAGGESEKLIESWKRDNENLLNIKFHSAENSGFGAGHNLIFQMASQDSSAYLCLNPDGIMHSKCLELLIGQAEKMQMDGIFEAIQEPIMHPKKYDPKTGNTAWCSAACLLIPSKIYRKLNGFDDDFFMYCEDVDFSWRAKAAGYGCYICPDAWFLHYAMDRVAREVEIWKSACILAHKWRSNEFKIKSFNILASFLDMSDGELRGILEKVEQHTVEEVFRANPNFKNNLSFSEMMWNA